MNFASFSWMSRLKDVPPRTLVLTFCLEKSHATHVLYIHRASINLVATAKMAKYHAHSSDRDVSTSPSASSLIQTKCRRDENSDLDESLSTSGFTTLCTVPVRAVILSPRPKGVRYTRNDATSPSPSTRQDDDIVVPGSLDQGK